MTIRITATPKQGRWIHRPCLVGEELRQRNPIRAPNGFLFSLVYLGVSNHQVGKLYPSVVWTYSTPPTTAHHWSDPRHFPNFEEQNTEFTFETPNYNFTVKVTPTLALMPL